MKQIETPLTLILGIGFLIYLGLTNFCVEDQNKLAVSPNTEKTTCSATKEFNIGFTYETIENSDEIIVEKIDWDIVDEDLNIDSILESLVNDSSDQIILEIPEEDSN